MFRPEYLKPNMRLIFREGRCKGIGVISAVGLEENAPLDDTMVTAATTAETTATTTETATPTTTAGAGKGKATTTSTTTTPGAKKVGVKGR